MDKILKIKDGMMLIGKENGSIEELSINLYDGKYPSEGKLVNIYKGVDGKTIVSPVKDVVEGKHVVNKGVYILLAFFLGIFGVHRFYSKRYITAVMYLLFSWTTIPMFCAFWDIGMVMFSKTDNQGNIAI